MVEALLVGGLLVAVFVGFNIGGSSTGVAFGPAVGSRVLTKLPAAGLMTAFALLGGWTVGRNVVETMGGQIVPSAFFTLPASVAVLFFIGFALLISNLFGVPASTSMTAVGAIAGLGVATGSIDWEVMGRIVSWWIVAPVVAFWVCAVVGRYLYPYLEFWFDVDRSAGSFLVVRRAGPVPYPNFADDVSRQERVGGVLVIAIGCYMAFSAGASNTANAVAPLVGSRELSMDAGILLAAGAIGLGAFTIARRTLDTVGNDLTDLPLLAALVVEVVAATIITFLSWIGIPASLAVSATMSIVGLGWGRATRTTTLSDAASAVVRGETGGDPDGEAAAGQSVDPGGSAGTAGREEAPTSRGAGPAAERGDAVPRIGEVGEETAGGMSPPVLFDPKATGRVIGLWILTPSLSAALSYLLFRFTLSP